MGKASSRSAKPSPWPWRILALGALALTLILAGPRAWRVLATRRARAVVSPRVQLDRVGFRSVPDWAKPRRLLLAILDDLQPRLRGRIGIMDEAAARSLETRLRRSAWVRRVRLHRRFPDRFEAELWLRRPVLAVQVGEAATLQCLVDREGVSLPPVEDCHLPRTILPELQGGPATMGLRHPDARVRAAALVAVEWHEKIRPLVADAPKLAEVDASNLGYAFIADGRWSEVRVGLTRDDGAIVRFGYGHPPGGGAPRVPVATKAEVLHRVLGLSPGLAGLQGGDLRFANRWRDWLVPRPRR